MYIPATATSNGISQDLVWITYNPTGKLIATWRDRRNAGGAGYRQASEIMYSVSNDNGATWSTNYLLSNVLAPYDSILDQSGNDFMTCVADSDSVSAVWGDMRSGALNIYFSKASLSGGPSHISLLGTESWEKVEVFPNPSQGIIALRIPEPVSEIVPAQIMDASGKRVREMNLDFQEGQTLADLNGLNPGIYFLKMKIRNTWYGGSFLIR